MPDRPGFAAAAGRAVVLDPSPMLVVEIEPGAADEEIHLHVGGQGFWVAQMLGVLGVSSVLTGCFGGEPGRVLSTLVTNTEVPVELVGVEVSEPNGTVVYDRRSGQREEIARADPPALSRHAVDDLYSAALGAADSAQVAVLTGPPRPDLLPADTYRRLAADWRALGVTVVADLSGPLLLAALEGGVDLLKVSDEDLVRDGFAAGTDDAQLLPTLRRLHEQGAAGVVISRGQRPALALVDGRVLDVVPPPLQTVDSRGAGDSMTAGMSAALARGGPLTQALQLGTAAGGLNSTRRGLATGQRAAIEQLVGHVELRDRQDQPE
jgi:1-phosphofructokinase